MSRSSYDVVSIGSRMFAVYTNTAGKKVLTSIDLRSGAESSVELSASGVAETFPAPVLSSVSRNGLQSGGDAFTITGTGLTSPSSVLLDAGIVSFTGVNATTVNCITGFFATGLYDLSLATANGSSNTLTLLVYSLDYTTRARGSAIRLTGEGFSSVSAVTIGGVSASYTGATSTKVDITVPAGAGLGSSDIVITIAAGTFTLPGALTVTSATTPRTVTAITPDDGSLAGGTAVTLTGTDFSDATAASIGGIPLTSFSVVNDTTITGVTANLGAAGTYDVVVSGGTSGTATLVNGFTATEPVEAGIYTTGVRYRGINVAGAEYGDDWDGWSGQTFFTWRSTAARNAEMTYFGGKGFNCFRLPISWERLQHTLNGAFNTTYQTNMMTYVNATTAANWAIVLDLHNYNRYATNTFTSDQGTTQTGSGTYVKRILGDGYLTNDHIIDVWTKLATLFVGNDKVIFNLMNEPHDFSVTSDTYVTYINDQIAAIRATGATNLILIPNSRGSDVTHWSSYSPNGGSLDSVAFLGIVDPGDNYAFDMHAYSSSPASASTYTNLITPVTNWAITNGKRLFLSEMGTNEGATNGAAAMASVLAYMNAHSDVWIGWAPWNLSPYNLTQNTPTQSYTTDGPSMAWYTPYLTPGTVST